MPTFNLVRGNAFLCPAIEPVFHFAGISVPGCVEQLHDQVCDLRERSAVISSQSSQDLLRSVSQLVSTAPALARLLAAVVRYRRSQVRDNGGVVEFQLRYTLVRRIHHRFIRSQNRLVHDIAGGLIICKQRYHREQRLNFLLDPLDISLFLEQNSAQIFHRLPLKRKWQFRTKVVPKQSVENRDDDS
jgi:hypothetical protein